MYVLYIYVLFIIIYTSSYIHTEVNAIFNMSHFISLNSCVECHQSLQESSIIGITTKKTLIFLHIYMHITFSYYFVICWNIHDYCGCISNYTVSQYMV